MSASENEILRPELVPPPQLALPEPTSPLPGMLASAGTWLGNTRTQVRRRARQLREEYPLTVIGVFMGTAFVFGVAIRVWSSHER